LSARWGWFEKNHLVGLRRLKPCGRFPGLLSHVAGQDGISRGELLLATLKLT
jgi:hypothetical protein